MLSIEQSKINNIIKHDDGTYTIDYYTSLGKNLGRLNTTHWREVPGRDDKFRDKIIQKYGQQYFDQNYANAFLGSSNTLISSYVLSDLSPAPYKEKFIDGLRVYHEPIPNHNYIISVDAAKEGIDAFGIQVIDVTNLPFIQVAAGDLQVNYLKMPIQLNSLGTTYNNAFMIIENNEGAGQSICDTLYNTFEYENLYRDRKDNNKFKSYYGFRTTTKSKKLIITLMKTFIENNKLIINDRKTISELESFIEKANGSYSAEEGYKDDLVMSLAISMGVFINVRGFENQLAFINNMFDDLPDDNKDDSFDEVFSFGSFDDGTNSDDDYHYKIKTTKYDADGFEIITGL